jgi:hypothetical protein
MGVVVETSSQHINGKLERIGIFELMSDRELHAQPDREGPDGRARI